LPHPPVARNRARRCRPRSGLRRGPFGAHIGRTLSSYPHAVSTGSTPSTPPVDRRDFLKQSAGLGVGALLTASCRDVGTDEIVPGILPAPRRPLLGGDRGHVVIIGAGSWGGWTAYELLRRGAKVTLIDAYGPGNSRSTSGDETRGVRSSYGNMAVGELWMRWAREAMTRWQAWDAEWSRDAQLNLFFKTGDVILRAQDEPFTTRTRELWEQLGIPHEVLTPDEVRYRWPVIDVEGITVALSEPDAGVVRARRSCQAVVDVVQRLGGRVVLGRARLGASASGALDGVVVDDDEVIRGDSYVFACGPWLRTLFPDIMGRRMRTPLGYVVYFGTPEGDHRFAHPNIPSWNFPGVTGWPTLPVDSRGFRVRGSLAGSGGGGGGGGGAAAPRTSTPAPTPDPFSQDPDRSSRWTSAERIEGSRRVLAARFPALADAPVLETRACHYESSIGRNFVVDQHPDFRNTWITGCGNAEGFKFGPVMGAYIAQRVLGDEGDPEVAAGFKIPENQYDEPTT
jgi:sarcosine oxidase